MKDYVNKIVLNYFVIVIVLFFFIIVYGNKGRFFIKMFIVILKYEIIGLI